MPYIDPFTAVSGAVYLASEYNTYTRDNFNALFDSTRGAFKFGASDVYLERESATLLAVRNAADTDHLDFQCGALTVDDLLTAAGGVNITATGLQIAGSTVIDASENADFGGTLSADGDITFGTYFNYDTSGAFLYSPGDMYWGIDSDNDSTANQFIWYHNGATTGAATEIMRLTDEGDLTVSGALAGVTTSSQSDIATIDAAAVANAYTAYKIGGTSKGVVGMSGAVKGNSDDDLGIFAQTGLDIVFMTNGSATDVVRMSAFNVFVGDTANANMTQGLTINQGGNDDEILAFKSSDVAHGITSHTETDTFVRFKKVAPADGGFRVTGMTEDEVGVIIEAFYTNDDTGKNGSADAAVIVSPAKKSGTNIGAPGANANLFSVRDGNSGNTKFIVDFEGEWHYDGAGAGTEFDSFEDAELSRALALVTNPDAVIRSKWDDFVRYGESHLVSAGILGDTMANGGLVNGAALQRLHNGAIWQLHTTIQELSQRLELSERKLAALEV